MLTYKYQLIVESQESSFHLYIYFLDNFQMYYYHIVTLFGACAYSQKTAFQEIIANWRCAYIIYFTVNFQCAYIRVEAPIHL